MAVLSLKSGDAGDLDRPSDTRRGRVPTLETPTSPGGSQASAGEGLSPCNIGIGWLEICC